VRRERVVSIARRGVGGYALTLEDGIVVPVGRRYRSVVRAFVAGAEQA
jgi:DNA-binding LytR/AlgR family response regulator